MATTVLVVSKQESNSVESIGNNLSGYRVTITVEEALNINPKIFIMQREVITPGNSGEYEDQFYSVASVAQIEAIPEAASANHPFYRTDSISLVFETVEDLRKYTDIILGMIDKLRKANDLAINMQASTLVGFPAQALARYWGLATTDTITDEILLAGPSDNVFSKEITKTITNSAGPRHLYVAIRSDLGALDHLYVNGSDTASTLTERTVTDANGYAAAYRIYCTGSFQLSPFLLETV